jgi:hypothetical protein
MKYYAGIGSRETPKHIQTKMTTIARRLNSMGYCLRSGGADGADDAFEKGAVSKQIFLPWEGFNGRRSDGSSYIIPPLNLELVEKYHPKPSLLTKKGLKFMSRNSYQVLGPQLVDPVEFVLCWTEGGNKKGGTAQAIRIAEDRGINVFNFGSDGLEKFSEYMYRAFFFG